MVMVGGGGLSSGEAHITAIIRKSRGRFAKIRVCGARSMGVKFKMLKMLPCLCGACAGVWQ